MTLTGISCRNTGSPADLIIKNAVIWTGNSEQPYAEAMAVAGDTILAVGTNSEVMKHKTGNTVVTDLNGMFVTPGFIDSHVHLYQGGANLSSVKLRDAATPEEFIKRMADFAATLKPGTWILGGDWDEKEWGVLPQKEWIDSVTPDNPVFVTRLDEHMGLANSLALKMAGITGSVKNVAGGAVGRNEKGELTGIFRDNAMDLIFNKIPPPTGEETESALSTAMDYMASNGVTSVHAVDAADYIDALRNLYDKQSLITRIYAMGPVRMYQTLKEQCGGDKWIKYYGTKGFVDGSLGSHTAAFMTPYSDMPTDSGLFVNTKEELYSWISGADSEELQVAVHAIGDRAINFLLDTYQRVTEENGTRDRRFRIEHAQHLAPSDIERFAGLNVIASMQPYHAIDDGRWADDVIGPERAKTTYAFRSLLDAKAVLAFGSDWPVAPATPLEGIYAAATRRTLDDENPDGWVPEQKITPEEALKAYTYNAAYASFDEKIKGTLETGKLADFTVLDQNILTVRPELIRETKVLRTYVGGRLVYEMNEE